MKRLITLAMVLGLVTALAGTGSAKPVTNWEDVAGDAGNGSQGSIPGFAEAGFDLVGGTIDKVGQDLVFTVAHAAMPATNQPGEAFRFMWHFDANGKQYRWTVKTLDIGKPDVVAQTGQERVGQVYTAGTARLEEGYVEATPAINLSQFKVIEYLDVTFDATAKTMTWKMPLSVLKLKPGSQITPGTGGASSLGCQICWVLHYAERSLTAEGPNTTTIDTARALASYKIPR